MGSGSSASRTYLPVSDVDLVLLAPTPDEKGKGDGSGGGDDVCMRHILSVFRALCLEVASADSSSRSSHVPSPFVIRNVEFVNARTKVVHCLVNNIGVDLTINQAGAISAAAFIEECDRLVGRDHLLKRSLLLIKVRPWLIIHASCRQL